MTTLLKTFTPKTSKFPLNIDDFIGSSLGEWYYPKFMQSTNRSTPTNIIEDSDKYIVELVVPGFDKGDFKIEVNGDELSVSAKKETKLEEKDQNYTVKEYDLSEFSTSFRLSNDKIDFDKIDAEYINGIMTLTINKKEEVVAKPKAIAVK